MWGHITHCFGMRQNSNSVNINSMLKLELYLEQISRLLQLPPCMIAQRWNTKQFSSHQRTYTNRIALGTCHLQTQSKFLLTSTFKQETVNLLPQHVLHVHKYPISTKDRFGRMTLSIQLTNNIWVMDSIGTKQTTNTTSEWMMEISFLSTMELSRAWALDMS